MDGLTTGLLLLGILLGFVGLAAPPIVNVFQKTKLAPSDFALQSFFPAAVGIALMFGCGLALFRTVNDDAALAPLITGGIAILTISTACLVSLFATDRVRRMAN